MWKRAKSGLKSQTVFQNIKAHHRPSLVKISRFVLGSFYMPLQRLDKFPEEYERLTKPFLPDFPRISLGSRDSRMSYVLAIILK